MFGYCWSNRSSRTGDAESSSGTRLSRQQTYLPGRPREEGTLIDFKGETIKVQAASRERFQEADIALFAVGTGVSKELAPQAVECNCVVIDNSYAFRLVDDVPLVVPEVNPEDISWHKGIIANPNCSTIIMVVAINPIHKAAHLTRVIVSTYQAVSGAGKAGLEELTLIPGLTLQDSPLNQKYSSILSLLILSLI